MSIRTENVYKGLKPCKVEGISVKAALLTKNCLMEAMLWAAMKEIGKPGSPETPESTASHLAAKKPWIQYTRESGMCA